MSPSITSESGQSSSQRRKQLLAMFESFSPRRTSDPATPPAPDNADHSGELEYPSSDDEISGDLEYPGRNDGDHPIGESSNGHLQRLVDTLDDVGNLLLDQERKNVAQARVFANTVTKWVISDVENDMNHFFREMRPTSEYGDA